MKIIIFIVISILIIVVVIPTIVVIKLIVDEHNQKKRREGRLLEKESKKLSLKVRQIKDLCKKWTDQSGKLIGQDLDYFEGYCREGFIIIENENGKQIAKTSKTIY